MKKFSHILGIVLFALGTTSFAKNDSLVCVAGVFGENFGEPGHLMGISVGAPNLVVIDNGTASLYSIEDLSSALDKYRLNKPFDLSIAKLVFEPVKVMEKDGYINYDGSVSVPDARTAYLEAKTTIFLNRNDLTGTISIKIASKASSILYNYQSQSEFQCSTSGVK